MDDSRGTGQLSNPNLLQLKRICEKFALLVTSCNRPTISTSGHLALIEKENKDVSLTVQLPKIWHFEISNEVANKVGGIYTVIRTKVPETMAELGQQYCLMGPYNRAQASTEVEILPPKNHAMVSVLAEFSEAKINVYFGRWQIEGRPNVILFDLMSAAARLSQVRREIMNGANISLPENDSEMNDACILGDLVSWFIASFVKKTSRMDYVQSHFHEWQAGVGLMLLRMNNIRCSTTFTTHATLLGRHLCASNADLYNNLEHFDVDREAGIRNIYHKYCVERASVHMADVFTTVSDITGVEAEHLLKRKPDVILPNGLNVVAKMTKDHQFRHERFKLQIHEFIRGHFYGHLNFDLDKTVYFFIAGRLEFRNKGADIYIEALARLNHFLQYFEVKMTVVAFMIFPGQTNGFNAATLQNHMAYRHEKKSKKILRAQMGKVMYENCLRGEKPPDDDIKLQDLCTKLKKALNAGQRSLLPPICTHDMRNDDTDDILLALRNCQLFNQENHRVKVVYHPEFLNSTNPLFGLDYNDFVQGCHLGVFPSYYEPWGYTPAECAVQGIPSVTSNLAGFGCFAEQHVPDPENNGIIIVDRRNLSFNDSAHQLALKMMSFCKQTREERIEQRDRTESLSGLFAWSSLGQYYRQSRDMAFHRKFGDSSQEPNMKHQVNPCTANTLEPSVCYRPD